MRIASEFGQMYWDGPRDYGYGGYKYDGRWRPIAEAMAKHYGLKDSSEILDIGCGKGFLLLELRKMGIGELHGIDISNYAICDAERIFIDQMNTAWFDCAPASKIPYTDGAFDFTYSINVFHNLSYSELKQSLKEMLRVGKEKFYICVESYETEEQLCNLQCWALTCKSFYSKDDWRNIFSDNGYEGDYEFITFD